MQYAIISEYALLNQFLCPYQMILKGSVYENNSLCALKMTH